MVEWPCEEVEEVCEAEEGQWLVADSVEDMEIKDGVDKVDMEVMDGEMAVPNGVVVMAKAKTEATEEAMEGLKDMVEVSQVKLRNLRYKDSSIHFVIFKSIEYNLSLALSK